MRMYEKALGRYGLLEPVEQPVAPSVEPMFQHPLHYDVEYTMREQHMDVKQKAMTTVVDLSLMFRQNMSGFDTDDIMHRHMQRQVDNTVEELLLSLKDMVNVDIADDYDTYGRKTINASINLAVKS